jgi:hypothetical protein
VPVPTLEVPVSEPDDDNEPHAYREIRFVFHASEMDQTFVYCLLADGWHFKAFAASKSIDGILAEMKHWEGYGDDPRTWPVKSPE